MTVLARTTRARREAPTLALPTAHKVGPVSGQARRRAAPIPRRYRRVPFLPGIADWARRARERGSMIRGIRRASERLPVPIVRRVAAPATRPARAGFAHPNAPEFQAFPWRRSALALAVRRAFGFLRREESV